MKKVKHLIGFVAATLMLTSYSAMAADADVKEAYFKQNSEVVHTLSDGSLECVINASGAGSDAVMINCIYEQDTNKLLGVKYVGPTGNEFKNVVYITDAQNTYVTMCVWDSLENAVAKTQVYSIASNDPAPEIPWNVKVNNNGVMAFEWGECEDNIKTKGYRVYKNNEMVADITSASYNDGAKWYDDGNDYTITAYDEYGNESEGKVYENIAIDTSNMAAILFSQPNITEKMSLYIATGKETDESWYGYNVAEIKEGVPCRRIPADGRAVFKYSSDFKTRIGDGVRDAVIRVTYFDEGTDSFKISYVGKGARYTTVNINKTNTGEWVTKEIKVSDFVAAYMDPNDGAKTQDENVDFSIWSKADSDKGDVVDLDTYISELQVILDGVTPTPAPTLAPGATPTPVPTEAPTPTPVPTVNPADIKTASVNFLDGQTTSTCSESEYNLINIFWAGKNNDGQINKTDWYAYNYGATESGESCRAIDDNKRLVLIYDSALNEAIGSEARNATFRVKYLDNGTDKLKVSYISKTKRYTDLDIQKTDSGEWKWTEFTVTDMVNESDTTQGNNGGYQDGKINDEGALYPEGPNLSIWSRGSGETTSVTEYISEFELVLDVQVTPQPTAAPTPEPSETDIVLTQNMDNSTLENIAFAWSEIDTASGYNVYRNDEKLTEMPITEVSYTDEGLAWYENYTYKVEAVDAEGAVVGEGTAGLTVNKDNFGGVKLFDGVAYNETYAGEKMTVYWGGTNQHAENTGWYGYHAPAEIGNLKCRMIAKAHEKADGTGWVNNQRISLRFDESMQTLIGSEPREAKIRVLYYDNGTDGIRVSYMSSSKRYTDVVINKTDTNEWKWYELDVTDLVNVSPDGSNGLQDESTYFSIWGKSSSEENTEDTDTYIAEIQFVLK